MSGYFERLDDGGSSQTYGFAALFAFYLVLYTVINFCNAALVGTAMIRLRGGDPTASDVYRLRPAIGGQLLGTRLSERPSA